MQNNLAMRIKSNIRHYDVHFADTPDFLRSFERFAQRTFVVDENVWRIYGDNLLRDIAPADEVIVLPIGEELKNLDSVRFLYDRLTGRAAKRNMTMISIGGGITQDITGFAASTLYRGINWVFVPTTLLAQADSCIGSKTSLNYENFKNLIGTFYPPSEVFIHTGFLATQTQADYFSGLGEVIKLHLLGGAARADEITELLPAIMRRDAAALLTGVRNSLEIKHAFISEDEFDTGRRNLLNYGHCFGHALESTSNFEVPHGQAIVAGMLLANIVARHRTLLPALLEGSVAEKLLLPSLVVEPRVEHLDPDAMVEAMRKDKKRTGSDLALIMLEDGYEFSKINDLGTVEVARALKDFRSMIQNKQTGA